MEVDLFSDIYQSGNTIIYLKNSLKEFKDLIFKVDTDADVEIFVETPSRKEEIYSIIITDDLLELNHSHYNFVLWKSEKEVFAENVFVFKDKKSLKNVLELSLYDIRLTVEEKLKKAARSNRIELSNECSFECDYLVKSLEKFTKGQFSKDPTLQKVVNTFIDLSSFEFEHIEDLIKKINEVGEFEVFEVLKLEKYSLKALNALLHDDAKCISIGMSSERFIRVKSKKNYKYLSIILRIALDFLDKGIETEFSEELPHENDSLWEDVLNTFDHGVCLINGSGEILVHNSKFASISILPKDCLSYRDNQKVEVDGKVYILDKKVLDSGGKKKFLCVFKGKETDTSSKNKSMTSNDLGIITSSIAHELKNPLAGILASLSLLMLDYEESEALVEMKEGADRCKDLIDIFLGFSKASPNLSGEMDILTAFLKAKDLAKFRMVESSIIFNINHKKSHSCQLKASNLSLISMVFYLILSEIITSASHQKLVEESESKSLELVFHEKMNEVELKISEDMNIGDQLKKNRLLDHLVNLEGMNIFYEGNSIRLSEWTLV